MKRILNYLDILDKWPIKSGISLTQAKMTSLELKRFMLEDGEALEDSVLTSIRGVFDDKDPTNVDVIPYKVSKSLFFCPSENLLQFVPYCFGILKLSTLIQRHSRLDGDKCLIMRDGIPFWFVL